MNTQILRKIFGISSAVIGLALMLSPLFCTSIFWCGVFIVIGIGCAANAQHILSNNDTILTDYDNTDQAKKLNVAEVQDILSNNGRGLIYNLASKPYEINIGNDVTQKIDKYLPSIYSDKKKISFYEFDSDIKSQAPKNKFQLVNKDNITCIEFQKLTEINKSVIQEINSDHLWKMSTEQLFAFLSNENNDEYILKKHYAIQEQLFFSWLYRPDVFLNIFILEAVKDLIIPCIKKIIIAIKYDKFNQLESEYKFLLNDTLITNYLGKIDQKISKVVNILKIIGDCDFHSPQFCLKQAKVNMVLARLFEGETLFDPLGQYTSNFKRAYETNELSLIILKPGNKLSGTHLKALESKYKSNSLKKHNIHNYVLQSGDTHIDINIDTICQIIELSDHDQKGAFANQIYILTQNYIVQDFESYMHGLSEDFSVYESRS